MRFKNTIFIFVTLGLPIVHRRWSSDIKSTLLNSFSAKSGRPSASGNDPENPDITISSPGSHFTSRRPASSAISLSRLILSSMACCLDMAAKLKRRNHNNHPLLVGPKWTIAKSVPATS